MKPALKRRNGFKNGTAPVGSRAAAPEARSAPRTAGGMQGERVRIARWIPQEGPGITPENF
jgi:hypothetical protein